MKDLLPGLIILGSCLVCAHLDGKGRMKEPAWYYMIGFFTALMAQIVKDLV